MPQTYTTSQSINIPENVKRIVLTLVGGGGGGEYINRVTGNPAPGTSGGSTTFLGLTAGGGQGGGIGGRNSGGSGGVASSGDYIFPNLTLTNGGSGGINAKGTSSRSDRGNGGDGTTDQVTYYSTITHQFNDWTNQTTLADSSPDIYFYLGGESSSDMPCGPYYFSKHYKVRFNFPYDDTNYSIGINYICPYTAAGGYFSGYASNIIKYTDGFDIWFCKYRVSGSGTVNSFVGCFNFTTSGRRSSLKGRGGGGGATISGTLSREDLVSRGLTNKQTSLVVGTFGEDASNTSIAPLAFDGQYGYASVYIEYLARATIVSNAQNDTIIQGESVQITWNAYGDIEWCIVEPGIAPQGSLYTGTISRTPTATTTYFIRVYGAIGGSAEAEVTVTVLQPPSLSLVGPLSVNYGSNVVLSYEATNAVTSLTLVPTFYFTDGTSLSSAEYNISLPIGESVNDNYTYDLTPWGDFGPSSISFRLVGVGYGRLVNGEMQYLQEFEQLSVSVNIDTTPDLITIPETDDALKNQDPVFSPKEDSFITLRVDDIDIPVTIKSDYPIQVQIDDDGVWRNIEST